MGNRDSMPILGFLVDRIEVGIFAVDKEMRVVLWNHFMAMHSGKSAQDVIGRNLFECFPELPRKWLEKKIHSVFVLKNYSFTSWEQRPYLFRFFHNRPVTGGVEAMQQSCTFLPIKNDKEEVENVCVTVFDYTDTAIYQKRLTDAIDQLHQEKLEQHRLIVQLQEAQDALQKLASSDGLTGLANRRIFDKTLINEWNRSIRYNQSLSLLMIDVDYFKRYNDHYGHQKGDACLQFVASAMAGEPQMRAMDLVARYGGEEFAVILPSTDQEGSAIVGERIRQAVESLDLPHGYSEVAKHVTVSIGSATIRPEPSINSAQLISAADAALYRAKREGRNRVIATAVE